MPEPAAVPESTTGFVLNIEEFDNGFVAHGLMGLVATDKTRDGAIEKLRKLTIRQIWPNLELKPEPAASPVAGVSAPELPNDFVHTEAALPFIRELARRVGFKVHAVIRHVRTDDDSVRCVYAQEAVRAIAAQPSAEGDGWIAVTERLPEPSVFVLGWLHLPKNPPASGPCLVQYSGCDEDEPENYADMRRTAGCWWGNGRYYERGHVTHWRPLPAPPVAKEGRES